MKTLPEEQTMTIRQISTILDVSLSAVTKRTRKLFPDMMENGKVTRLNEAQVTILKKELFDKNPNLGRVSEVKTDLEKELIIKQALMFQNEKVQSLTERLAIAEPKANLADAVVRDTETQYSIRDAGKHLGLRQKEIFTIMRDNKLLTQKRLPTQKALDKGVLTTKTNTVDGKNRPQAVMTMENVSNFRKQYNISEVNNG